MRTPIDPRRSDVALTVGIALTLVATLREQPAVTAQPVEETERA